MREVAGRRRRVEQEYAAAVYTLHGKQQEVSALHQAQLEVKREHEGTVQLLEARVHELEHQCRAQGEQFALLSRELQRVRGRAAEAPLLSASTGGQSLAPPSNGLDTVIGKCVRRLPMSGLEPDLHPLKASANPANPANPEASGDNCPGHQRLRKQMDVDPGSANPKMKYTGRVRLCVARYSYNPYKGPNEHPEAELPLRAGKYLYVYGDMDEDGFYEGELMDGRRGLVPSNFVALLVAGDPALDPEPINVEPLPPPPPAGDAPREPVYPGSGTVQREPGAPVFTGGGGGPGIHGWGRGPRYLRVGEEEGPRYLRVGEGPRYLRWGRGPGITGGGGGGAPVFTGGGGAPVFTGGGGAPVFTGGGGAPVFTGGGGAPVFTGGGGAPVFTGGGGAPVFTGGGGAPVFTGGGGAPVFTGGGGAPVFTGGGGLLQRTVDEVGEDVLPYPRRISLIKQLGRTAIVGWEAAAVPPGGGTIHTYNVLVDGEVRVSVPAAARPKALLEKLMLAERTYRVSVTALGERGISDPLRCSLLIGRDVCLAPTHLALDTVSHSSATVSWRPSDTNYRHAIILNGHELDVVAPACYRYHFYNLAPGQTCRVRVAAHPHQVPWQLPLEQRQLREALIDFCTLPTGPPAPPQEGTVQVGVDPGTLQIKWKPPVLGPLGTSNGARVTGYSVCAKGQKVAEVQAATAESVTVDLVRIQNLEPREIIVRTVSVQGESEDSCAAAIPMELLSPPALPPRAPTRTRPPDAKNLPPLPAQPRRSLEPIAPGYRTGNGRSPSPQRILPQPQGAPISDTVAKAMAREAAQRVIDSSKQAERRSVFSKRSSTLQQENSDEEDGEGEGYDAQNKRPGASVDDFLRRSELGRQQLVHGESYQSESSRGSDLSDIMEEDEEELHSEMLLDAGGRRRLSGNAHTRAKMLGYSSGSGRGPDRMEHSGRRASHGGGGHRARPMTVPSIEITVDSNSEGGRSHSESEGTGSPGRDDAYYRHVTGRRKWPQQRSAPPNGRYERPGVRDRRGPDVYEDCDAESGADESPGRVFVALFDYDPLSMSPNPDAAVEELPFQEGQIIQVHGCKDADGFYHGESAGRAGLIPCNMVSEIEAGGDELERLLDAGFLPLNTPVQRIAKADSPGSSNRRSRKSKRERNRRTGRPLPMLSRRMVALYDYDPRESSPNVDVEAELTFCAGDIVSVWGELDEDGFYYGEMNGHRGLVPSNFLEEVPDDVEVYLSDAPSRFSPEILAQGKGQRVPGEHTQRRVATPTIQPHHTGSAVIDGPNSPVWTRDMTMASKKKKGLLSKGKKLLRKLGGVK
ncbi:LOW QUALITY PROTEIN: RIMS-binding protein 2 [Leucoraja erinacea]|uniref:LOW QUALITY PROTEIN: RIMS-binding protein 2 n=1 Tax=Leucoraja erinaceus TaxID=7782 RepID=UPI002458BB77|nr:LOW QUALITY PROTEIN: RIMS-binding protein 2 [Leucoraja erinacea]